jgi:hypothetical protein
MNKRIFVVVATLAMTFVVVADPDVAKVKAAKLVIASPAEPGESVVPELSEIVVLCAQDEKKKFEGEWARYVKHHKLEGKALEDTIKDVSDKASWHRGKEKLAMRDAKKEAQWKAGRQELMNEVARKLFEPSSAR